MSTILEVLMQMAMLATRAILPHSGHLAMLRAQIRLTGAFRTHPTRGNELLQVLPGALGAPRRRRRMQQQVFEGSPAALTTIFVNWHLSCCEASRPFTGSRLRIISRRNLQRNDQIEGGCGALRDPSTNC